MSIRKPKQLLWVLMNGPRSAEDEKQRVNYILMFYLRTEQVMLLQSFRAHKRAILSLAVCLSWRLHLSTANISN